MNLEKSGPVQKDSCSSSKKQSRDNQIGIGCLISPIRNQNAKPHCQQDTELNVGEFLEQLQFDEQRVSEHGGHHGQVRGKDQQHVHQQTSNSSSPEEPFEEA